MGESIEHMENIEIQNKLYFSLLSCFWFSLTLCFCKNGIFPPVGRCYLAWHDHFPWVLPRTFMYAGRRVELWTVILDILTLLSWNKLLCNFILLCFVWGFIWISCSGKTGMCTPVFSLEMTKFSFPQSFQWLKEKLKTTCLQNSCFCRCVVSVIDGRNYVFYLGNGSDFFSPRLHTSVWKLHFSNKNRSILYAHLWLIYLWFLLWIVYFFILISMTCLTQHLFMCAQGKSYLT